MHKSLLKSLLFAALAVVALTLTPLSFAQVVTSGMTGTVKTADGKPVSGASVTAVHTTTNTTFRTTTNADGRFSFRSLPVGGTFSVTTKADGFNADTQTDIETQLGNDIDVNVTLRSDVVKLEAFVVSAEKNSLDSNAQGASALLTRDQIEIKASTQRSLGLTSFFNPLAIEAIEQISTISRTADVRYSGFTGAAFNVVTKSGTNELHGAAYYIFSGDHLFGRQTQGPDARTLVQTGAKVIPHLERTTKGLTLGGPIWKDHLFFFIDWEKFERIGAPNQAGLPAIDPAAKALIDSRIAQISRVSFGNVGGNNNSFANDEKRLFKVDWNISDRHQMSASYFTTEGQVPQFGNFTTTSFGAGLNNNSAFANLVGGPATAYESHFFAQTRKEKSYSVQVNSHWTPDFTTEVKYSHVNQDQSTPTASVAPEIRIFGVAGTNQANAPIANGVVVLGTERFRQGNQINVETKNYSANADYQRGNVTFSAGFDMEDNSFFNLFRQFSFGVFDFASPTDFLNNNPRFFTRNFTDLSIKGSFADISQWTQTGFYGKIKWDASDRLRIDAGLRYDLSSSSTRPTFNQQFFTDTGQRNDGTIDGATDFSPRVGFNWSVDEDRKTQIRGTAGYFLGRAPWVFWSNSYGNTGAGTFTVNTLPTGGLTGYLANNFDPANPSGTAPQTPGARAEVDLADDKMHLPSQWSFNLAVDHKLDFLSSTVTAELVYDINDNQLFITNDNLKVKGTAADGRVFFFGNPNTPANAKFPNFTNIFHLRNVKAGESTYATLRWTRPMKQRWAFDIAYTRGRNTEAQASGQTTASGMWQRNAVFNQDQVENGRSDFEVRDLVQAYVARQFEFVKKWRTTVSLYYEGRTGSPYSFAYSSDLNQDGMPGNDLVSVPTDLSDSRFDFSGLSATQQAAMLAFFQSSGLNKFAGGHAPKNSFYQPWVNRLDLKFKQDVPLHYRKAKLSLELDFTNFGTFLSQSLFNYVERAPSTINDVFERRLLGNATIDNTTGKIRVTSFQTSDFLIDNTQSRWRIQVAARLTF
ncbi:MAG: TonB-dependent receptor [Opitutae bacterium]|nr:TonB-dependent receptor [Opitutae bacterium]